MQTRSVVLLRLNAARDISSCQCELVARLSYVDGVRPGAELRPNLPAVMEAAMMAHDT